MPFPDMTPKTNELSVETHIAAPPEAVWKLMTERMTEWWCPKPWYTEIVEQNWHAGGRSAMVMKGPEGEAHPVEGIFLEVTPGVRFVTTDAVTADMRPAGPFMIGIWEIQPLVRAAPTIALPPAIGAKKICANMKPWDSPMAGGCAHNS